MSNVGGLFLRGLYPEPLTISKCRLARPRTARRDTHQIRLPESTVKSTGFVIDLKKITLFSLGTEKSREPRRATFYQRHNERPYTVFKFQRLFEKFPEFPNRAQTEHRKTVELIPLAYVTSPQ